MNWLQEKAKVILLLSAIAIFSTTAAYGYVYVYEVVTNERTFLTASKMHPNDFLHYLGGKDVIYSLKIKQIYADKDYKKALRDYSLEDKNVRYLPHIRIDNKVDRRPYYWWR